LASQRRSISSHERNVLVATCLSSLGSYYSMAVTGFALPQIQRGLAIPEDEVGSLFALLRFGAFFSIVLAVLADRVGRRMLLIVSVAGCALCSIATAFAQTGLALAWMQMGVRFFVGAQILLSTVIVAEELSAENRGWGIGVLSAIGALGGALTLLAFAFVDHLPFGWRSLFAIGGLGLLCVPWLWRSLNETQRFSEHRDQADASNGPVWKPIRNIAFEHGWRLAALIGVVVPVTIILEPSITFVSKHLQDNLGYSPAQVGLFIATCGAATPVGSFLSGGLSDRLGRKPVTFFMSLLLSLATALFYNGTGILIVGLGMALLFLSVGSLVVLHGAIATELFPTGLRSTAAGTREVVGTIGASLGLWVLSLLFAVTGSHAISITWVLLLTPISPLIILFIPETARRELEEITPEAPRQDASIP
jgi:putative MFS transporter